MMTETCKIRDPEWSHIHERDNRIIELEDEVQRLRAEVQLLDRIKREGRKISWDSNLVVLFRDFIRDLSRDQAAEAEEKELP